MLFSSFAWANSPIVYDIAHVKAQTGVNVRASNSVDAKVLGQLRPKDFFAVSKKDDWYVILDGPFKGGYIKQEFVNLTGESYPLNKAVAYDIRLRAVPSANGVLRGELAPDEVFAAEREGDWVQIKDGPHKGQYVAAHLVADLDAVPTPKPEATPELIPISTPLPTPTPTPSPTPTPTLELTQIPSSTPEPTTESSPTPAVQMTPGAAATPAPGSETLPAGYAKGVVIAKTAVNVRAAPSAKSPRTGSFSPGIFIEVEPAGGEWYKIQSGLNKGSFIAAPFVKIVPGSQQVVVAAPVLAASTPIPTPAPTPVATPTPEAKAPSTSIAQLATTSAPSQTPTPPPALMTPAPSWDQKTEQIFKAQVEKAFKKKAKSTAAENEVVMPVFFESRNTLLGQVDSRVRPGEPLVFEAPPFFKFLRLLVTQTWFDKPEIAEINPETAKGPQELAAKRWVAINKFDNTGITVSFDPQRLDIVISVPPELRAPTVASLLKGSQVADEIDLAEPPTGFSSYLNINASETFDTRYTEYSDRRMPLRAQLENGTNIGGVVLEANARYYEDRTGGVNNSTGFARGDVRLVKDFPSKTIRTSAGDLVYPTIGHQTFRQMGGVSITSNFTMARSKLTYPTGNYEVFLQRNSKVYIWVNDQLQQVLDLPAGRHSLKDFPFVNGANDLRLEIIDDVGREEVQRYSYFSNTELLRPELHQYNYSIGAPATDVGNQRIYDSENSTVSAFHRYGLFENLTIGANVQADKSQTVTGLEALWSTSIGFFKLEPAVSILNNETGGAVRANYTYSDYKGAMKTQRTYRLGLYHAGSSFASLGASTGSTTKRTFELTTGYSQGLRKNLSMNFNGSYRSYNGTSGIEDAFSLGLGANQKWNNGLSTSATLTHSKSQTGSEELNLFVFLLWSFPKDKQIVSAISNSTDESTRVDWSYNPSNGADSSSYGASLRDTKTERGYSLQLLHDGNRTRSSISHEVVLGKVPTPGATGDDANKKPTHHVTALNFGTSLAFAGGHFAIGRPVTDSFAIIAPVKNLRGQRLDVNPIGDEGYTAKTTDLLGAALLPELGSYNFTDLTVSGKKLPAELNLPKDHFSVYPQYKSGYVFEIGTDATVYITAKVLAPNGEAISLAAGQGFYLDESGVDPVTIFTNKKGVLNSEGFKPGRYRLEISTDVYEPIEITIPESASGAYDLGTLKLKAK